MGKWEETYSEENPLREALRNARQAGGLNGGQDRVQFIGPLLDAIVNQSCKWTSDQCARFLEKFLRKYVENEDLELLLATFGFGSNYKNLKIISMRRKKFLDDYPGKYNHSDSALKKREDKQVDRIVRFLELVY